MSEDMPVTTAPLDGAGEGDQVELKTIDESSPLNPESREADVTGEDLEKIKVDDGKAPVEAAETTPDAEVKQPKRKFDFFENKWILLGILIVLLLAIIIIIIAIVVTRQPPSKVTVEVGNVTEATEPEGQPSAIAFCGEVMGRHQDGAYVFTGIPYAEPPIGDLRWKPPVPVTSSDDCWNAPFNATQASPFCYQKGGRSPQSEDCLYVDVFTPSVSVQSRLPVMVYIPADDVTFLKGTDAVFAPSAKLAEETGMVFVRFNYRVGAFGYLPIEALGKDSGNFGLLDQVEALRWVRANILGFGGDKSRVTVFGVGAGAASVLALISSPLTKGLFQRAWISSGVSSISGQANRSVYEQKFVMATTCQKSWDGMDLMERAHCLRQLSADDVAHADYLSSDDDDVFYELPSSKTKDRLTRLTVNSHRSSILQYPSNEALMSGTVNKVPLLIGSMGQEVNFYYSGYDETWNDMYSNVTAKLKPLYKSGDADKLMSKIEALYPRYVSPRYQLTTMVSDILVTCPLNTLAALTSSAGFLTYRYQVLPKLLLDSQSSYMSDSRWAFHGYDIATYFGQLEKAFDEAQVYNYDLTGETPTNFDFNFKNFLRMVIYKFASSGSVPKWQNYNNGTMATYELDKGESSGTAAHAVRCDFWNKMGLTGWEY